MIIGLDRTPKGRLWAAWVGNGDSPNGFFMLATSEADGAPSHSRWTGAEPPARAPTGTPVSRQGFALPSKKALA